MSSEINSEDSERAPLITTSSGSPRTRPARPFLSCCRYCVLSLALVALVSIISISYFTSAPCQKTFPPDGPGVGIYLSTDYHTVSIRQDDVQTIASLPALDKYIDLIKRLSLKSSQHPAPPYDSLDESARDRRRQWYRNFRKNLGYPASSDVGIIADALQPLIAAASDHLPPGSLTSALVVVPNAIALYPEDVTDALEFLGLQAINGHNVHTALRALPAAYAGSGYGLCAHPADFELCLDEEQQMPTRGVMVIDANRISMGIDAQGVSTPMYVFFAKHVVLDWDAGLYSGADEIYWNRVRNDILHVITWITSSMGKRPGEKVIDDVIMVGEMGDDERLIAFVREVVAGVQKEEPVIRSENVNFVVSKGAAELAKRVLMQGGRFA